MSATSTFVPEPVFTNYTGENNPSHISRTALVYERGALPTPWPYILVSVSISYVFAIFGYITVLRSLFNEKKKKKGFVSRFRIPMIHYHVYRTIMMIVLCARAPQTRVIPSSLTTGIMALSFMCNVVNWEHKFDYYSYATVVCPVILWCLLIYQASLNLQTEIGHDSAAAFGYGTMRLLGGNCPRLLAKNEVPEKLVGLGCGEAVEAVGGLRMHVEVMKVLQYASGLCAIIGIGGAFMGASMWKLLGMRPSRKAAANDDLELTASDDNLMSTTADDKLGSTSTDDNLVTTAFVLKHATVILLTIMMCFIALLAMQEGPGYVDSSLSTGPGAWTDYFTANAPRDRYGFLGDWVKQEWNEKKEGVAAARAAFLAFVS